MADVENWLSGTGIVVPTISNDGYAYGNFVPGTGLGAVDIYGFDSYPLGFDCSMPSAWTGLANQYFPGLTPPPNTPNNSIAINPEWNQLHQMESPTTPLHVSEVCLTTMVARKTFGVLTNLRHPVSRRLPRYMGRRGI